MSLTRILEIIIISTPATILNIHLLLFYPRYDLGAGFPSAILESIPRHGSAPLPSCVRLSRLRKYTARVFSHRPGASSIQQSYIMPRSISC